MTITTARGEKYARMIHAGEIVWQDDVPKRRRQEAYDAYVEIFNNDPQIEPPEV